MVTARGSHRPDAVAATAAATGAEPLLDWVEATFGGTVTALEPLPRWRAGWYLDVANTGATRALYARGARGPDFPSPFDLAHEQAVHRLLADHGVPVPEVHGIVRVGTNDVMVMDRVPGVQGLDNEPDPQVRRALMLECVEHMVRMHAIDPAELARRGFEVPRSHEEVVHSGAIARLERHYLGSVAAGASPDPAIELLRRWLHHNRPDDGAAPAFVTWDSAQFLHHQGRLTALIDFELAHVGHPLMDLAPLRSRDTMDPLGDLAAAFAHYETLTGEPVDRDAVRYFEVAQLTATLMLQRPVLLQPDPASDLVTHIVWYVESARYAFDVLAEILGITLDIVPAADVDAPCAAAAHGHLVASLHRAARDPGRSDDPLSGHRRWRARCDYRLARHLQRVDQIGEATRREDLAEVAAFLGRAVRTPAEADEQLSQRALESDPSGDRELLRLLDRRMQRRSALLGPPGSLLTRHVPLQPMP